MATNTSTSSWATAPSSLGHSHPDVVKAVAEQMAKGTHLGANTEQEVRWADAIKALMPYVEKMRFHSSGTEATLMAFRLARAFTRQEQDYQAPGPLPWLARLRHGRLRPRRPRHSPEHMGLHDHSPRR